MKKPLAIGVWLALLSLSLTAGDKWSVSAGVGPVFSGDERFKDLYGTAHVCPELKAGYAFYENLYLWLGYSRFSAAYTIPELLDRVEVCQQFLALGIGWELRRGRLQSDFFVALAWSGFREHGLGESVSASAPGFQLGTGLRYYLTRRIFAGLAVSYSEARVTLEETDVSAGGRRLLGGLRLAAVLGLRF